MGYQSNQRKPKPHQQKSRIQSRMAKCPVWLPCPIRSVTFVQTALWTEFPFIGEDFPNWNRSSPNRNLRFPKWNPISANGSTVPKSTRSKCPGRTLISSCSGGKSYFEHLATSYPQKIRSPLEDLIPKKGIGHSDIYKKLCCRVKSPNWHSRGYKSKWFFNFPRDSCDWHRLRCFLVHTDVYHGTSGTCIY